MKNKFVIILLENNSTLISAIENELNPFGPSLRNVPALARERDRS
jgi:hypothetical protein